MRWKVAGVNQETGNPWALIILARDAEDAQVQAQRLGMGSSGPAACEPMQAHLDATGWRRNDAMLLLVLPGIAVALVTKALLLLATELRRSIISD